MRDRTLKNVQLSQENTVVFISELTKAYRWIKPTNTHAQSSWRGKKTAVVISRGNSYSFNILNLSRTLRDLGKGPTGYNCAVAPFSEASVAAGLALLSKGLHSLCIYITNKVFIHNQEHAKGSKWKVSEISHPSRWLRLIQMHLFLKALVVYFTGYSQGIERESTKREASLGCYLVYLDALRGPGGFQIVSHLSRQLWSSVFVLAYSWINRIPKTLLIA